METHDYEKWKSSVLASNKQDKKEGIETVLHFSYSTSELKTERQLTLFLLYLSVVHRKKPIQTSLNFVKEAPETQKLEVLWDGIVSLWWKKILVEAWYCVNQRWK